MSKISILVPTYNCEKYIKRCIESIQNQTYTDIEIVIVNDGSTDNTINIINKLAENDKRVKVYTIKNNGVANARNYALKMATGEFFAFVDSDDFIEEDYLETLYKNLIKYEADISICNCINHIEDENKTNYQDFGIKNIKVYSNLEAVEDLFYYHFLRHSPWGKLCKRKVWNGIEFPVGRNFEDLATIYKIFLNSNKLVYIPDKKYNYLVRKNSIVHKDIDKSEIEAIIDYTGETLQYITQQYPLLKESAEFSVCTHSLNLLYKISNKPEYKKYIKIVKDNLKKYRIRFICNSKVTIKQKLLLLISFFGMRVYKKAFSIKEKFERV